MEKLRITQTLLSAWEYSFKTDSGYDDFLKTINREPKQPTTAMLDGIQYESVLNNVLKGEPISEDHKWYKVITEMADELSGAQQQVSLFRETDIVYCGYQVLIHGILDYLKAGHIFDCKYSKRYALNKYFQSPQHPLYLSLVPEALDFTYIVSDGTYVYHERYPREIVPPIEPEIKHFLDYCKQHGLWETLSEKWRVNE